MVLEGLVELDDGGVAQAGENASFNENFLDAALVDELRDQHLLQAVELLLAHLRVMLLLQVGVAELDLEHSSVGPIADFVALRQVSPC